MIGTTVQQSLDHLSKLSSLADAVRENPNRMVLAQAEGIAAIAERKIADLFKFNDIWGDQGCSWQRGTSLTGTKQTSPS